MSFEGEKSTAAGNNDGIRKLSASKEFGGGGGTFE